MKSFSKDAISHCRDSIEGRLVTGVDELKRPDCANVTEKTGKDAEVETSGSLKDNEDITNMGMSLSKKKPRSSLKMMKAGKQAPRF
jgi:hypothetical protein